MSFFDNNEDPFDSIVREFFGGSPIRRRNNQFIENEEEDRTVDFIEDESQVYLIFELPGFSEKDISINIKGKELEISAEKNKREDTQEYLNQKLSQGLNIKKKLPSFIKAKNFKHTMKNGVLEIIFKK